MASFSGQIHLFLSHMRQEYERTNMDIDIDFYQFGGSWVEQHWQWELTMLEDNGNDNTVVSSVALTWFISPLCVWQLSNTQVLEIIQHFISCTLQPGELNYLCRSQKTFFKNSSFVYGLVWVVYVYWEDVRCFYDNISAMEALMSKV